MPFFNKDLENLCSTGG